MSDTFADDKPTAQHSPLIPLSLDQEPITWESKNYASIDGVLTRLHEAFQRDGTFPLLFKFNAASRHGKVYVDTMTPHPGRILHFRQGGRPRTKRSTSRARAHR